MEKFARQAINDGVTDTEELTVSRDSELYRALNMHYNKANDFEVSSVHVYVSLMNSIYVWKAFFLSGYISLNIINIKMYHLKKIYAYNWNVSIMYKDRK